MDEHIQEILLRNNMPHVVYVKNRYGELETLVDGPVNIDHVVKGLAELNRKGVVLLDIQVGNSLEGITKIKSIYSAGIFKNDTWIKQPVNEVELPEDDVIPFKSDSWALGEFIIKLKTGKNIPKRFLQSQNLLNTFIGDDDLLKKLLVIDPIKRSYSWDITKEDQNGCIVQ